MLCLSEPVKNNLVIVCNPITGEFIKIPEAPKIEKTRPWVVSSFGFNPNTNQYKVVRMYDSWDTDRHTGRVRSHDKITEVYTLDYIVVYIQFVSFDFETELFQLLPLPHPHKRQTFSRWALNDMSMGVLWGYLCIFYHSNFEHIEIWVIKDYGIQGSWVNVFSIDIGCDERWLPGLCQVIKCYDNEAVSMFHCRSCLIYHDPTKMGFRYFKIRGSKSNFEAFTHVPSLISLKDVLVGKEVEVLNVNSRNVLCYLQDLKWLVVGFGFDSLELLHVLCHESTLKRCGQFKLREENLSFCFVEEDREIVIDSDAWMLHHPTNRTR
ncbi:hypothetical protein REPUB_Repub07fG0038700 [Reevesia pubescens]